MKIKTVIKKTLLCLLTVISFASLYSAMWYIKINGNMGFTSVVFTVFSGIAGAESGLFGNYFIHAFIPEFLFSLVFCLIIIFDEKIHSHIEKMTKKKISLKKFKIGTVIISLLVSVFCITYAIIYSGMYDWLSDMFSYSKLYETEYVEPDESAIEFPEEKRNLIYIYLESMTTTFLSQEHGGAFENDIIPNLYDIAQNNINFSQNDGVGGWGIVSNTNWTMASLVSQTAGVPFLLPIENNSYGEYQRVFPGLTTLSDILHDNGYYQVMMVGSDGTYAGRDKYYLQHGTDEFLDNEDAKKDGIIAEDYSAWWGMEDMYLYRYAKMKLEKLSKQDSPFCFTMLTVDTHHIGGYHCSLCESEYEDDYSNVFKCADRQINEFLNWLSEQDFYENTTIVICGDHRSMDNEFMERNTDEDFDHRIYNCFINSAVNTEFSKNREISPFDMFPTTLASIGCKIKGERLGLGVNLFSGEQTLSEKYGFAEYNSLLEKNSMFYLTHFIKNKK